LYYDVIEDIYMLILLNIYLESLLQPFKSEWLHCSNVLHIIILEINRVQ